MGQYFVINGNYPEEYLEHHGIIGQKWGVRRYQNPDGSLTAAGRIKYKTNSDGTYSKRSKEEQKIEKAKQSYEAKAKVAKYKQMEKDLLSKENIKAAKAYKKQQTELAKGKTDLQKVQNEDAVKLEKAQTKTALVAEKEKQRQLKNIEKTEEETKKAEKTQTKQEKKQQKEQETAEAKAAKAAKGKKIVTGLIVAGVAGYAISKATKTLKTEQQNKAIDAFDTEHKLKTLTDAKAQGKYKGTEEYLSYLAVKNAYNQGGDSWGKISSKDITNYNIMSRAMKEAGGTSSPSAVDSALKTMKTITDGFNTVNGIINAANTAYNWTKK